MKRMKRQSVWRSRAYVLSVLVFAVSFIASLASTTSVIAEAAKFKIKAAEITTMSAGATGAITGFDDSTIASEVSFYKLNDSATFKVTLENTDSVDHVIKGISDNNSNENISYSYDNHADETITAGSAFDFVFTAKYVKSVTDMSKRAQSLSVEFAIQFADITEPETISVAPNTHDGITGSVIILSISSLGLIVCAVIFIKNHKQSTKALGIAATVIAAAVLATSVSAIATEVNSFTLTTNYGLYDKVVVSYGDNDYIVDYGKTLEEVDAIEVPSTTGLTFEGWEDEDGNEIDPTAPITEDIKIVAVTTANRYSIVFDKNETAATGEMNSLNATYGTPITLTSNAFEWAGYNFVGWATTPTGDVVYENGAEVSNLTSENNGAVTLYAKWERPNLTLHMMGNGRKMGDTNSERNTIKLDSSCHTEPVPITKTVRSSNLDKNGEKLQIYDSFLRTKDVVSISGASKLVATVKFGTESGSDPLYVFSGVYDGEVTDSLTGYVQVYSGWVNSFTTRTVEIPGDTATFAFYTDEGLNGYGFYATIIGYDADGNEITWDKSFCDRTTLSGEYMDLASGNYRLEGWSEDPNAKEPTYETYDEVLAHLPGDNGETKTVYAVWTQKYHLTYDGNGSSEGDMTMVSNDGYAGDETSLYAPNYLRSDYGYIGWSIDNNAQPNGSSVIYGPNEILFFEGDLVSKATNDGEIVLYAIWVPKETAYTLQTFNASAFEITNPGKTITALEDTRDGQPYAVAKLADGKWWMIENLRLDPAGKTLDNTNTNNPTTAFTNLAKNRTSSSVSTCTDDYNASCINTYSVETSGMTGATVSPTENNAKWLSSGIYYNWHVATAGNGTYSTGGYTNVTGDICPAGWQLPSISNNGSNWYTGDITVLDSALGGNGFPVGQYSRPEPNRGLQEFRFPVNFTVAGRAGDTGTYSRNRQGNYWSRTSGNSSDYSMAYYGIRNYRSDYGYLTREFSPSMTGLSKRDLHLVRCVAK